MVHPTRRLCTLWLLLAIITFGMACSDDAMDGDPAATWDVAVDLPDTGLDADDDDALHHDRDIQTPNTDGGRRPPRDGSGWDWDSGFEEPGFEIEGVIPPTGPVRGNTRVQIRGDGLSPDSRVFFGSQEMPVRESGGHLVGRTPQAAGPGPVTVKVLARNGEVVNLQNAFTYVADLEVDSVLPSRLPGNGGYEVTIEGHGFEAPMGVSFSGRSARRVDVVTENIIRVITPVHPRGFSDLRLTTPSQSVEKKRVIEFYDPLFIEGLAPSSGPLAGGQTVVLHGEGFTSQTSVRFDGRAAPFVSVDPAAGTLTVQSPATSTAGLVDIVAENANDSFILENGYLYRTTNDPVIAAVHPGFGPTTGGTRVWIVGHGLGAADLDIRFGSQSATIESRAAGHAVVLSPPGSVGLADIVLRTGGIERDRLEDGFDYRPAVEITDVSPGQGPTAGGEVITIEGTGFLEVDTVDFGVLPAAFEIVSNTRIRATSPRHSAGKVDVTVQANELEARMLEAYEYVEPLEIWGFSPVRGAIAGGTHVAVRGQGFQGLLEVELGNVEGTDVRRLDGHNLYFYTPPNRIGEARLIVKSGDESAEGPYPFAYFDPLNSFGGASGGDVVGSVNVTVLTMGGGPVPGAFVMLSTRADTPYQGVTDRFGQVTLSGPDVLGPQIVTATAANFTSATVQAVDAENLTVFLTPLDGDGQPGAGDPPPFGMISGTVSSTGKTADPAGQKTFNMAVIRTTQRHIQGSTINPGPNSVINGAGEYEIRSRIGDVAVIALCGHFDSQTNEFTPEFMAVERFIFVSDRGQYDVDLDCDIPLDEAMTVKLVHPAYAPDGPNNNIVNVFLDFGFEGVFPTPHRAQGLGSLLEVTALPAREGNLEDVTFTVVGGSYTGAFAPYTQTSRVNVADISHTISLPPLVSVPEADSPIAGGIIHDRQIRFRHGGPSLPSYYMAILRDSQGLPIWQFVIPGHENVFKFPEFPDFSALPADARPDPFPPGPLFLVIYGMRIPNFIYDNFSYRDMNQDRWEAFAVATWSVRFQ
ncbi:MAG: IPT/TIG domain-containing protein [Bradymonadaceae bacterium]